MSEATPGPWEIDHSYQWPGKIRSSVNGRFIADASRAGGPDVMSENMANAALIASAPEMFNALKWFVDNLRKDYVSKEEFEQGFANALSALAKATGEANA